MRHEMLPVKHETWKSLSRNTDVHLNYSQQHEVSFSQCNWWKIHWAVLMSPSDHEQLCFIKKTSICFPVIAMVTAAELVSIVLPSCLINSSVLTWRRTFQTELLQTTRPLLILCVFLMVSTDLPRIPVRHAHDSFCQRFRQPLTLKTRLFFVDFLSEFFLWSQNTLEITSRYHETLHVCEESPAVMHSCVRSLQFSGVSDVLNFLFWNQNTESKSDRCACQERKWKSDDAAENKKEKIKRNTFSWKGPSSQHQTSWTLCFTWTHSCRLILQKEDASSHLK